MYGNCKWYTCYGAKPPKWREVQDATYNCSHGHGLPAFCMTQLPKGDQATTCPCPTWLCRGRLPLTKVAGHSAGHALRHAWHVTGHFATTSHTAKPARHVEKSQASDTLPGARHVTGQGGPSSGSIPGRPPSEPMVCPVRPHTKAHHSGPKQRPSRVDHEAFCLDQNHQEVRNRVPEEQPHAAIA